jgi:CBS domain containing-hemolysin-like protein
VLGLRTQCVADIMIAWEKVVSVKANATVREVLRTGAQAGVNRFPVVLRGTKSKDPTVVSLVNLRALLYDSTADDGRLAIDWATPILRLTPDVGIAEALERMQQGAQRLALVSSERGVALGVVSVQDILQTIFGQVHL